MTTPTDKETVERYEPSFRYGDVTMEFHPEGRWVEYDEAKEISQALQQRITDLEQERDSFAAVVSRFVKEADLEDLDQDCLDPVSERTGWDCWIAMARDALDSKSPLPPPPTEDV